MLPLSHFSRPLRKEGFKKDFDSSSGGIRVVQFCKDIGAGRVLRVQLWADGKHRASHFYHDRASTAPTEFYSVQGMHVAILHETMRTDHKPRSTPEPDLRPKRTCHAARNGL